MHNWCGYKLCFKAMYDDCDNNTRNLLFMFDIFYVTTYCNKTSLPYLFMTHTLLSYFFCTNFFK